MIVVGGGQSGRVWRNAAESRVILLDKLGNSSHEEIWQAMPPEILESVLLHDHEGLQQQIRD